MTLWTYLHLVDLLVTGKAPAARLSGELRQHEDRHGSNPKALASLRWRIAESPTGKGRRSGSLATTPTCVATTPRDH